RLPGGTSGAELLLVDENARPVGYAQHKEPGGSTPRWEHDRPQDESLLVIAAAARAPRGSTPRLLVAAKSRSRSSFRILRFRSRRPFRQNGRTGTSRLPGGTWGAG